MSLLILAGVLAFALVVAVLPSAKRDGYSASSDTISEGALGRYGVWQKAAFVVLGLASLLLAAVVADETDGRLGTSAAVLLGVWALGVLLCGVFDIDEDAKGETTPAKVHLAAAFIGFIAAVAAVWLTTFAVRTDAAQDGMFGWSLVLAVLISIAFVVVGAAPQTSSWGGLAQRGFIVLLLAWFAAAAVALPSEDEDAVAAIAAAGSVHG